MGVLYRAKDPLLRRDVAIKVLSADLLVDAESRERFFREARAAATLQHRNVVTIFEVGESQGLPYLVLELLKGEDLERRMISTPPLTLDQKLDIVCQLCAGLHAVHEQDI